MLTPEQVDQFHRDGFLNAGKLIDRPLLDDLTAELDRIIALGPDGFAKDAPRPVHFVRMAAAYDDDAGDDAPTVWQVVNIWQASRPFERLLYFQPIVDAVSRLTGFADLQVWHDQVQYKPGGHGGATGWHQDAPKWPTIEPMTQVSAWLPFDDADVQNGCMWMVPGSHRWGDRDEFLNGLSHLRTLDEFARVGDEIAAAKQAGAAEAPGKPSPAVPVQGAVPVPGAGIAPDEYVSKASAQPCPVHRGEVHFHHALTWHGSPLNQSDRPRRAIAIHYMNSHAHYTGRPHVMQKFIQLQPGQPMHHAGPAFPSVCREGRAIQPD